MSNKKYNWENLFLGIGAGYLLVHELSRNSKPVFISDFRIHHYLLGLGVLFTDNEFLQGLCIGAGIEDLPDFIDDLSPQYRKLSDNIRRIQGKNLHWKN